MPLLPVFTIKLKFLVKISDKGIKSRGRAVYDCGKINLFLTGVISHHSVYIVFLSVGFFRGGHVFERM